MRSGTGSVIFMFVHLSLKARLINEFPSFNNGLLLVRSCTPYTLDSFVALRRHVR